MLEKYAISVEVQDEERTGHSPREWRGNKYESAQITIQCVRLHRLFSRLRIA